MSKPSDARVRDILEEISELASEYADNWWPDSPPTHCVDFMTIARLAEEALGHENY